MKFAFISVARFESKFIDMWVRHHGQFVDRSDMFIIIHGKDGLPSNPPSGVNYILHDRPENPDRSQTHGYTSAEQSKLACRLLERGYDAIVRLDIDEFVVVDPAANTSLEQIAKDASPRGITHCIGLDVFHRLGEERDLSDADEYVLSVHKHAVISRAYSKPSLVQKPVTWALGNHRVKKSKDHYIDDRIVLFHLALVDYEMSVQRYEELYKGQDAATEAHLKRRKDTMLASSKVTPEDFDAVKGKAMERMAPQTADFLGENKTRFIEDATFSDGYYVRIPDRFTSAIKW